MALTLEWWQAAPSGVSNTNQLPAANLIVSKMREANDLASESLGNKTIDEIIKSVSERVRFSESSRNSLSDSEAIKRPARRSRRRTINNALKQQQQQQQQQAHNELVPEEEDVQTVGPRRAHPTLFYNPAHQQPTNMYNRQQQHKNLKPVHVSISQQTVNGLLSLLLLFIISICGCIGTIFIMSALTVIESLQTRGNCYLVSLALAQLLVNLFVIPSSALQIMAGDAGLNGQALCHYQWLTLEFSLIVSQLSFALIAADNYLGYCCSEKVITSVANCRQQQGHELVAQQYEQRSQQQHRQGPPLQKEQEVSNNRASLCHLGNVGTPQKDSLPAKSTKTSGERRELEEGRAQVQARFSLQRDFLRPAAADPASSKLCNTQDELTTVIKWPAPANPIRQFFNYSFSRHDETPSGHGESDGASAKEYRRKKPRIVPLLVSSASKRTCQPQVGDFEPRYQNPASETKEKPSNATRILARQFALETPGAQLKRPSPFNYRICCGRLRVLLWMISIWSLSFAYIIHQHERSFTAKFCSITSTHYQPILPSTRRPALHRDLATQTNLFPTRDGGIGLRHTLDDELKPHTSQGRLGTLASGSAEDRGQLQIEARERRFKRHLGKLQEPGKLDSSSVIPSSDEEGSLGDSIRATTSLLELTNFDALSAMKFHVMTNGTAEGGFRQAVAYKTIAHNLTSALSALPKGDRLATASRDRRSNSLGRTRLSQEKRAVHLDVPVQTKVDASRGQRSFEPVSNSNEKNSHRHPKGLSSPESGSQITPNNRDCGNGAAGPSALLGDLLPLALPDSGSNNTREDFITRARSMGTTGHAIENDDRKKVDDGSVAGRPQDELETSKADRRQGSGQGLTGIKIIDRSALWRRKPHDGRGGISKEPPGDGQIAMKQTVEVVPLTTSSAPLVWPPWAAVHYLQRQLARVWPASNMKGANAGGRIDAPESDEILESSSGHMATVAERLTSPPTAADTIIEREPLGQRPRSKTKDKGASVIQPPSMGIRIGTNGEHAEEALDYNGQWQVLSRAARADEQDGALEIAISLPISADKTSETSTWRLDRLFEKAELAPKTNALAKRKSRTARAHQLEISPIIPVYSQCYGISCHRNSSTGDRRAAPSAASAVAMTGAWGDRHKVPTNDKWNDEKLVLAGRLRRRSARHVGPDFSSTVHLENDKQRSRPKDALVFNDGTEGAASLEPDTKRRTLMNNVGSLALDAEANSLDVPRPMQMASFRASSRGNEQIRRFRNSYGDAGLIDPHRAGPNSGREAGLDSSTATELASEGRRSALAAMNNQVERSADLQHQSQAQPQAETKDFFWPMLLSSILVPSLVSSLLFVGAYFKMKEFKMRPYKPMPVNTVASTPPALLTPRSPIPLIAQRQVYAFDDQPKGNSSKLGSGYLTADQLIGKSARLNGGGASVCGASKLANEYAMLGGHDEAALSDSNSETRSLSECSSEHDDGKLLARAAHATARRVSEATELMQAAAATKTDNNSSNNNCGAYDKMHQNSSSPLGSRACPRGSIRAKSKNIGAADDLTDHQLGAGGPAARVRPHAQLNQVMSAPVNCVSLPTYAAASHIDERALSPEACYWPPSLAPQHATNERSPLEACRVQAGAPRYRLFQQPNHRATSFSAPPSANNQPHGDFGPTDNFSAREFTSYLRECELSAPLVDEYAYPMNASMRIERKRHSSPVPFFRPIREHEGDPTTELHHFDRRQQHAHSFHLGTSVLARNLRLVPQATLHEQQPTWPHEYTNAQLPAPPNQTAHKPRIYYTQPSDQAHQQQPLGAVHSGSLIDRNQSLERHRSLPANRRLALRGQQQNPSQQQRSQLSNSLRRHVELTQDQLNSEQKHAEHQSQSSAAMVSRALASVIRSVDEGDGAEAQDNLKEPRTIQAGQRAHHSSASNHLRPASRSGPSGVSSGHMSADRVLAERQGRGLSASDAIGGAHTIAQAEPKKRVKPPNLSCLVAVDQSQSDAPNASPLPGTRHSMMPLEPRDISPTADANSKVILCTYTYMTDEQLLKSNMIVFVVNLTLWVPFVALLIVLHYSDSISIEFKDSVWWLAVLNCCSCSYLYALTNKDFREAFNKLFYYCCCKSHVTFQRKTPIFRRQLDVDQRGNLRVHIIPALNVYSNKLFAASNAPTAPESSPTPNAPSRSPLLSSESPAGGTLAPSATIDHHSHQARLIHHCAREELARSKTSGSPKGLVDVH